MTSGYEPFEMIERHGVGNMLSLLWAYALHRGSVRLSYASRRVIAKAGSFETSWTEMPSVQDGNLPDAASALVPWTDEVLRGNATEEAVVVKPTPARLVEKTRRKVERLERPGTSEPEPWFRALQTAHRVQAVLESKTLEESEEVRLVESEPLMRRELSVPAHQELELNALDEERAPHIEREVERLKSEDSEMKGSAEVAAATVAEHVRRSDESREVCAPDQRLDESPAVIAEPPDPSDERRESILKTRDVRVLTMAEDVPVVASEMATREAGVDLTRASEETVTLARWPVLPLDSRSVSPTESEQLAASYERNSAGRERAAQGTKLDELSEEAVPARRRIARTEGWDDAPIEAWPALPEEPQYARADHGLERYEREQRRWNEQRGIL